MNQTHKTHQKCQSRARVFELALAGQVPHAIVMWNKHKSSHDDCICESKMFDQTLCGFCLLSGLQTQGLAQSCRTQANRFHASAELVSGYLMRRNQTVPVRGRVQVRAAE